ncbi:hypothetical protein [Myxococcus sp. RHSTA-1-4]|uniref:hypothetical protein n=1 Tax=Myxococcus sp. RHSTA-1-4 TaxID=2874601 RepID=UPI001CBB5EAE|nr:hypothetical protein [Myxococcus sp. RHSTA-1-4]MBZ4420163.1 hypothetical protein [Myxococcus sp. RHSTA-1-4]
MKRILTILRSYRLVRPMTEEEAKSISIELLRPLALEHERALKAGLDDEDLLAAFRHLARMSIHTIRSSLTKGSLLLNRSSPESCVGGGSGGRASACFTRTAERAAVGRG